MARYGSWVRRADRADGRHRGDHGQLAECGEAAAALMARDRLCVVNTDGEKKTITRRTWRAVTGTGGWTTF